MPPAFRRLQQCRSLCVGPKLNENHQPRGATHDTAGTVCARDTQPVSGGYADHPPQILLLPSSSTSSCTCFVVGGAFRNSGSRWNLDGISFLASVSILIVWVGTLFLLNFILTRCISLNRARLVSDDIKVIVVLKLFQSAFATGFGKKFREDPSLL